MIEYFCLRDGFYMNFVVVDLEWNQAMSSKSSVFNKLPIRLRGEIIQIGAVKLDENFAPAEEFRVDIRPVYFKRMHFKVKKLTGFNKERLSQGVSFIDAIEQFRNWCGDDVTFLTWGCDDRGIMEQNIIIHDSDWDWISAWVNLQVIFNAQIRGDKNQKSLATAMEHFGIEQTRVAHDALGDAYNTALVCSKLDLQEGIKNYEKSLLAASSSRKTRSATVCENPEPILHDSLIDYPSKGALLADPAVAEMTCPICGSAMKSSRWVNQGDQRYINIFNCPEHGKELVRLKFRKSEDGSFFASRLVYLAGEEMLSFYTSKSSKPKKRGSKRTMSNKEAKQAV